MCWLTDIVVPIVCALIGGGLTMWGVKKTLEVQKSENEQLRIKEARPYLFAEYPMQILDGTDIAQLFLRSLAGNSSNYPLQCYIKNSGNGIAIVTKVTTKNNTYIPKGNNVIDKSCRMVLNIFLADKTETMNGWRLFVEDIYGNEYCYLMMLDGNMLNVGECVEFRKSKK